MGYVVTSPFQMRAEMFRANLKTTFRADGTEGLLNDATIVSKGYCSTKVGIDSNGSAYAVAQDEEGKCSNCSSSLDAPDYGRTYYLIEVDDASMEDGYLVSGMRQGSKETSNPYETLDDAVASVPSSQCYVIGSVQTIDSGAIRGCTDATAANYDESAEQDDHSCIYCGANEEIGNAYTQECVCKSGYTKTSDGACVACGANEELDNNDECVCKSGYTKTQGVCEADFDWETHMKKYGIFYGMGLVAIMLTR